MMMTTMMKMMAVMKRITKMTITTLVIIMTFVHHEGRNTVQIS